MNKTAVIIMAAIGIGAIGLGWALSGGASNNGVSLKVYKSASCGCCGDWISHMRRSGFNVVPLDVADIGSTKKQYGIAPQLQSCHTAVSDDGYVFEGHIPARLVERFLKNPPEGAKGLSAPGMPMGSPGMDMGKFRPYDVMLLLADGSSRVYRRVEDQQYE